MSATLIRKIDVRDIIVEHFRTLSDTKDRPIRQDYILFMFCQLPRWTVQNRPLIDRSKPATTDAAAETSEFYFVISSVRKSVK
jgi:hypothetical protein